MKKTFGISTFLAIGFFAMSFLSCQNQQQTAPAPSTTASTNSGSQEKVVYFIADSVLANYALFNEQRQLLLEKKQKHEADLQVKDRSFQKKVEDFQVKIKNGLMTNRQAKDAEASLGKQRQDLLELANQLQQELALSEMNLNKQVQDSLDSFLSDYAKSNNCIIIPAKCYCATDRDITKNVTEGLNKRYLGDDYKTQDKK